MPSQFLIRRAVAAIRRGGVIAYPTEAVFGLGCDPNNAAAALRLLKIKQRSLHQGLIVIAADLKQVECYLQDLSPPQIKQLAASWPGPQTWLIPAADNAPTWLTGRHQSIAIRITAHPVAKELCIQCGHGLVSTSANYSGDPPGRTSRSVRNKLGDELDYILGGQVGDLDRPTPIRDLLSGKVLRS